MNDYNEDFTSFYEFLEETYDLKTNITSINNATQVFLKYMKDLLDPNKYDEFSNDIKSLETTTIDMLESIENDKIEYALSKDLCTYEYRILSTMFVNLLYNHDQSDNTMLKQTCANICKLRGLLGTQIKSIEKALIGFTPEFIDKQKKEHESIFKSQIIVQYGMLSEKQIELGKIKGFFDNDT